MSWEAYLTDDRGHLDGSWGYTHNCNRMANIAVSEIYSTVPSPFLWWQILNGMSGPEGAAFLHKIIVALEANPNKYRAMNPVNGWGDYDSFVKLLREMRDAVPEWPTIWSTSG